MLKKIFFNISLIFCGLLLGIIFIEFTLREIGVKYVPELYLYHYCHANHPLYKTFIRPNLNFYISNPPFYSGHITTNAWGFRGRVPELNNISNNSKSIFFLGDSMGQGLNVSTEKLFSSILEKNLNIHSKNKYKIFNFSIFGWNTINELLFYKNEASKFPHNEVCLLFFFNDVFANNPLGFQQSQKNNAKKFFSFKNNFIYTTTFFKYKLLNNYKNLSILLLKFNLIKPFYKESYLSHYNIFLKNQPDNNKKYLNYTRKALLYLKNIAKSKGAKFTIFYIPVIEELNDNLFKKYLITTSKKKYELYDPSFLRNYLQNFCLKNNIDYKILFANYINADEKTLYSIYIPKDKHLTEYGQKLLGEELSVYFLNRK